MITFNKKIDVSKLPLKDQYKFEMATIQKWLNDNDFIINKHTLGEYADDNPKWIEYKISRHTYLERYNTLQVMVEQIETSELSSSKVEEVQ